MGHVTLLVIELVSLRGKPTVLATAELPVEFQQVKQTIHYCNLLLKVMTRDVCAYVTEYVRIRVFSSVKDRKIAEASNV
jgi:hypothetical protein